MSALTTSVSWLRTTTKRNVCFSGGTIACNLYPGEGALFKEMKNVYFMRSNKFCKAHFINIFFLKFILYKNVYFL